MNLKEAFRYQNFLNRMLSESLDSIKNPYHATSIVKHHNCNKANPDAEDFDEVVEVDEFFPNDDVIRFVKYIIDQKENLTAAVNLAKSRAKVDVDALVEANKMRQAAARSIEYMMRFRASKKTESGRGYRFNAEGNQMPYSYDIDLVATELFDRASAKESQRHLIDESDTASSLIDEVLIESVVDYIAPFNVNDSFNDAMDLFIKATAQAE